MIGLGTLRQRIAIQQATNTPDAIGAQVESWGALATVWAQVVKLSAGEDYSRSQLGAKASWKVTIRWRTDINTKLRIVWRNHTLLIRSVLNSDKRRRFIEMICDEIHAVASNAPGTFDTTVTTFDATQITWDAAA